MKQLLFLLGLLPWATACSQMLFSENLTLGTYHYNHSPDQTR